MKNIQSSKNRIVKKWCIDNQLKLKQIFIVSTPTVLGLALAKWSFDIAHNWVLSAEDIGRNIVIWLLPSAIATTIALLSFLISAIIFALREKHFPVMNTERFPQTVIDYADFLAKNNQDEKLLSLRSGMNNILHTLSANKERIILGNYAYDASVRRNDINSQTQILIDDLGWANHMIGNDDEALSALNRALEIIDEASEPSQFKIWKVKAFRHKAIIFSRTNPVESKSFLSKAKSEVGTLPSSKRKNIEIGQLQHAEALCVCIENGINQNIIITNAKLQKKAKSALELAKNAALLFGTNGELSKLTKALFLQKEILTALNDTVLLRETTIAYEKSLDESMWNPQTILNLSGIHTMTE
jgi:hypothetical protein